MAGQSQFSRWRKTRPGASEAQRALVTLLRTTDRVRAFLEATFGPHGITGQQYNVLRILRGAEPEGLPTLTIGSRMIERAPGITRMIDRLEAKGLVARERRAGDRRCVHCRITAKGLKLLKRLDRPVDKANRAAFAGLASDELEALIALLDRALAAHEATKATTHQ